MSTRKTVQLLDCHSYFAMLVPAQTGVFWTNQCGGTLCAHPEIEALYVPLPLQLKPLRDPIKDAWWAGRFPYDARGQADVAGFLARVSIGTFRAATPEEAESTGQRGFGEAWVPAVVASDLTDFPGLLQEFIGKVVILTYRNSD